MFRIAKPLSLVVATGMCVLLSACCHGRRDMDPHKRADKIVTQMQKHLDLTADQTARVRLLASEIVDTLQADRHARMENQNGELLAQLRAPTVDTAALGREMQARESEMQLHMQAHQSFMIATFVQLHDILTPEQREKLAAFLEKHRDMMMDGGHPGE